ncbi:MAG: hypothetical protein ACXWNQ_06905 [Anaerolineales bacterium]
MKRFRDTLVVVSLVMVLLLGTAMPAQAAGIDFQKARFTHPLSITNPYFPLQPGTTHIFRGTTDGAATYEEFVITNTTEVVAGVRSRVVHDKNWESGKLIEDTIDWYAQDDAGNVWYMGEFATQIENGKVVGHEGSWRAGTNGARAGIIMEAHPQVGDTYAQENAPGIASDTGHVLSLNTSLCVTYGCFSHVLKTKETSSLEPGVVEVKYYALGIGEIRSQLVQGGSEENHLNKIVNK